ncbi:hypothetical protein [Nostoc sp. PCC 9305]
MPQPAITSSRNSAIATFNPEFERFMARRIGAETSEIKAQAFVLYERKRR